MKRFSIFTASIIIICSTVAAQNIKPQRTNGNNLMQNTATAQHTDDKVYDIVEQSPMFPGGMAAMNQWLRENIKYPSYAIENYIEGRVTVKVIVERDGSLSGAQVSRSVDPSLDKEAIRVVSSMPKWTPGRMYGRTVRVKFFIPVTFRLQ